MSVYEIVAHNAGIDTGWACLRRVLGVWLHWKGIVIRRPISPRVAAAVIHESNPRLSNVVIALEHRRQVLLDGFRVNGYE
jgi:hypothetical protein